jgi:hypothetical protein
MIVVADCRETVRQSCLEIKEKLVEEEYNQMTVWPTKAGTNKQIRDAKACEIAKKKRRASLRHLRKLCELGCHVSCSLTMMYSSEMLYITGHENLSKLIDPACRVVFRLEIGIPMATGKYHISRWRRLRSGNRRSQAPGSGFSPGGGGPPPGQSDIRLVGSLQSL